MTAIPRNEPTRSLHLPSGEEVTVLASGTENGGALFEIEATLPPGLPGPPRHRHRARTETFSVVQGRLCVVIGRDTRILGEGESAAVPASAILTFSNPFEEPARIHMVETPAGPLEEQFRALASSHGMPLIGGSPPSTCSTASPCPSPGYRTPSSDRRGASWRKRTPGGRARRGRTRRDTGRDTRDRDLDRTHRRNGPHDAARDPRTPRRGDQRGIHS